LIFIEILIFLFLLVRREQTSPFLFLAVPEPRGDDQIGALLGGTFLHTDGTEALSRLGAIVISPQTTPEAPARAEESFTKPEIPDAGG